GQLPARFLDHRSHEEGPCVLHVSVHDHRGDGRAEPDPAVQDCVLPVCGAAACVALVMLVAPSSFVQAYTVRVYGISIPSFSPSSTTAPTTGSNSMGLPASKSC